MVQIQRLCVGVDEEYSGAIWGTFRQICLSLVGERKRRTRRYSSIKSLLSPQRALDYILFGEEQHLSQCYVQVTDTRSSMMTMPLILGKSRRKLRTMQ